MSVMRTCSRHVHSNRSRYPRILVDITIYSKVRRLRYAPNHNCHAARLLISTEAVTSLDPHHKEILYPSLSCIYPVIRPSLWHRIIRIRSIVLCYPSVFVCLASRRRAAGARKQFALSTCRPLLPFSAGPAYRKPSLLESAGNRVSRLCRPHVDLASAIVLFVCENLGCAVSTSLGSR